MLTSGKRDHGGVIRIDIDWRPPAIAAELLAEVVAVHIPALERFLAPAQVEDTAVRVNALLGHYYTVDAPRALHKMMMADWLRALREYPGWAINQAAEDWLSVNERRPTIADIRRLCEFWVSDARAELTMLRRLSAAAPSVPATTH